MINHPAFQRVVARVIRTKEGYGLLAAGAHAVPAGWGATHADDLIDAVKNRTCAPGVAAALIGPRDTSARLLCTSSDISFAICVRGQLSPDAPNAWMDALSPEERDRLLATVQREPSAVAHCFPWLPPESVKRIRFKDSDAFSLLRACIEASPTAREHHAALLHQIVVQAKPIHLGLLTQLAYTMESENVWDRVCALVQQRPPSAYLVVDAVPWKNLPREVRTIGANLNLSIGAARGQHNKTPKTITDRNAAAFFAALDPHVWETLDSATQRRWKNALLAMDAHLAVQSLGLQPDILARAILHDRLVAAARLHAHDDDAVRRALFPSRCIRSLPTQRMR